MERHRVLRSVSQSVLTAAVLVWTAFSGSGASSMVPGEALVKLRPSGSKADRQQSASPWTRLGTVTQTALGDSGWKKVTLPEGTDVAAWVRAARSSPDVAAAEPNHRYRLHAVVNDPLAPLQYGLRQIGATSAWATATGSASVVVAVLDTGINAAHPDLAPALWRNPGEVAGNGFDDDGNGVADDLHGADFVDGDGDPADDSGHGSHVAGIIAAAGNNLTGGAGVAYGCRVMALRILSEDGSATTDKIVEAFEYVRTMKRRGVDVRVINNSWGGDFPSLAIFEAVSAAADDGILVVCSAGNEGRDNDGKPMYPTSYVSPGILSVAAGDGCDEPEVFSNVGVRSVHLAAPGGAVYSAYQGSASYASLSGTSMAAPHVSGAAALLLSKRPSLTLAQLRSLLLATVDVVPHWSGLTATGGRLNVARAMDWLNGSTPVPSVPPTNAAPILPIQLVSRSQSNRLAGASSFTGAYPRALSDDGRWVVFLSYATNLVAGDTVDNLDVFLRDTWSNTTVRVSQTLAGVGANDDCGAPVISADGAYVAFTSYADNLVSGDGNQSNDVFVWTRSSRALQRISKRPDGSAFDLDSANPSISADGGRVAFSADEDVGGGFSIRDVYVWNRSGNSVQFASLAPGGGFANDWSDSPSISANGRWVAFHSWADNLVSGDNNGSADVFVRDLNNGSNERVSLDSGGQAGNDDSLYPVISADGRWVAFSSGASNLGLSPGLGQIQTYLYDRDNDRLRPVSKTQAGTVVAGTNYVDSISGDGRFVLFSTAAPGLFPDYGPRLRRPMLFDRLTDALSPLAVNHAGFPADDVVFYPQITADGRRVSFSSWANNLVPDDGNNVLDVFVLDRGVAFADLRLRVPGAAAWTGWGEVGPNLPQRVAQALPGSGTATFDVQLVNAGLIATNFVLHATVPNGWGLVVLAGPGAGTNATAAALQGTLSSGTLALGATNSYSLQLTRTSLWADASAAVRLSVRRPGTTEEFDAVQAVVTWSAPPPGYRLASRTSNGTPALLNGEQPTLAADGRLVAFASASENLSPNDGNYQSDIFVWDRQNGSLRPVSTTISGTLGNGDSTRPAFSRNGRHLAFESYSDNLVAGDANERKDIFVKDLVGGSIQLASVGALGQQATRGSTGAAISGDGRYVLFQSIAPNLVPGDTNGCTDVFLKDLQSASIECVSRGPNGVWGNAASAPLQMTPDARFILFSSHATNLGFVDTNQFVDLFLLDRQSGVLSLVSQSADGVTGSGPGWSASLSDDGRVLVYRADSLGADGTSTGHIVLVDRQTSQRTELDAAALGLPEGFGLFSAKVSPDGRWLALSAGASCGGPATNHATQLFLHDRVTGATLPVSQTRDGRWAEKDLFSATFSGNGRYLAWATPSRTLLAEPWPLSDQVFVFDRANLQSDAAVRRDQQTTWRGDGVESATNAVLEQFLPLNTPRTFFLRITNLTEFAGAVRLTAPTGVAGRWTARYYAENAGGAEITASIASGWEFDPGNAPLDLLVRLVVTVLAGDDLPPLTVQVASVEFPVLVERITLGLSPDSDNDGMADPWERTAFGNLTTATATSDFDQDGALDFAEYQAGTDAKSAASVLRLGLTGWLGTNVSVVLSNTQPSRVYALESGGEVGSGFTGRSGELRGTGTPLTLSVPLLPAETNLFFRVKASLP